LKKLLSALVLITVLFSLMIPASAAKIMNADSGVATVAPIATEASDGTAEQVIREPISIYVDGKLMDDGKKSYSVDGISYVPLFDFLHWIGVSNVTENDERGRIIIKYKDVEINISKKKDYYTANGRCFYTKLLIPSFEEKPYMASVKWLCKLFNISWTWNGVTDSVKVSSEKTPLEPGSAVYDDSDLYWLSHIIEAEAGVESFEGKIAVGNVIVNRMNDPEFPDTIYDVIFDKRFGIQFSPAFSGRIYNNPGADSIAAAKIVLEGITVIEDAMYFQPSYRADICWAGNNRPYSTTIDGHTFWN